MTTPTDTHSAPRSLLIDRVGHSVLQRLLAGVNGPDQIDGFDLYIVQAVLHQGRIVVFLSNGAVFERDTDGSWSRYEVAEGTKLRGYAYSAAASVLL